MVVQLSLTKNQVSQISLAAILGGQTQAQPIAFRYLALETIECSIQSLF